MPQEYVIIFKKNGAISFEAMSKLECILRKTGLKIITPCSYKPSVHHFFEPSEAFRGVVELLTCRLKTQSGYFFQQYSNI